MKKSLEERVEYLENKVEQLEKQLQYELDSTTFHRAKEEDVSTPIQKKQSIPKEKAPIPVSADHIIQATETGNVERASTKLDKQPTSKSEPIEWEKFIFQTLLPRVFIFILILGVLWGLKASYDYGLITIQIILTLSILLSVAMAALGVLQIKKNRRILGQVLIGGSIPIFMLTIFSMHQMYFMIGPSLAMALNIVAIIAGIAFSYVFRSESIGIISVVAGVLVPYLIITIVPNYYVFVAYEAALYLLFLSLALALNMRVLYFVATFFLHIAILAMHLFSYVPTEFTLLTIMPIVFQQIALFGGLLLTKIRLTTQAYTLLTSLLLTSIWIGALLDKTEATTLFIGLAIMYALSFYLFKEDEKRAPIFIVNSTLAWLFIFLVQGYEIAYEVLLVVTFIHIFYAQRYKTYFLHYILATIQYLIAFILFSSYYIEDWVSYEMLHKLTFLIATVVMLTFISKRTSLTKFYQFGLPYFAFLLLFFSNDIANLIAKQRYAFDSMPLILSSFWVIIAIGYMIFSKITSITIGKFIGAAILFFTVAKVVLLDISFMSMTFRAILFIGLGLIGLLISRVYNKNSSNNRES